MKFCKTCGKELLDEAVICPGCGCAVDQSTHPPCKEKPRKKMKKKTKIIIITSAVVALLLIIAAILFLPRNVSLKTLTSEPNHVKALVVFGLPTRTEEGQWVYCDCIEINGIEVDRFYVDFENNEYQILDFNGGYELYDMIDRECDYVDYRGGFDVYSYKNATIYTSGNWFSIEFD